MRVPVRRKLSAAQRLPGIEYVQADLGTEVPMRCSRASTLSCTPRLRPPASWPTTNEIPSRPPITCWGRWCATASEIVNISSVAVLKPATAGKPLREDSPVDADNLGRGPYVWAKATAELAAVQLARPANWTFAPSDWARWWTTTLLRARPTGSGGRATVRRRWGAGAAH